MTSFRESRLPSVCLPDAIARAEVSTTRSLLENAAYESLDLAHRGAYRFIDGGEQEPIARRLLAIAEELVGCPVEVVKRRWLRLGSGDYSLLRDDATWCAETEGAPYELTVDVSDWESGEGEVVYTHRGQAFFTMPQRPGTVALVQRGPTVGRYDRYLTHRIGERLIRRIRWALR